MAEIRVKPGLIAKVDDTDFELVSKYSWFRSKSFGRDYAYTKIMGEDGKRHSVMMHRLIMNAPKNITVDHINRDSLDNRRSNLRLATRSQNCANKWVRGTKLYKGVFPSKSPHKPWFAKIGFQRKSIVLGFFKTQEDAALAYDQAAKRFFGEFALTNF